MVVLQTCKNEEDPIKIEGTRVLTILYVVFQRWNSAEFRTHPSFYSCLVTCKNEEDPIKNEGARVLSRFTHYKSMGIFSDAQEQLTPQSLV